MWLFELFEQFVEKCTEEKARAERIPIHAVEQNIKSGSLMQRIMQAGEYSDRLASPDMNDQEIVNRFKSADNAVTKSITAKELENRGYLERDTNGRYARTGKSI